MPELPEVETVKNQLVAHVIGRTIREIELQWAGMVRETPVPEFLSQTKGQKIMAITRHGKYMLFHLSNHLYLVVHLKMTGSLLLGNGETPKYTRATIHLNNGQNIYFRDPRKFGVLKMIKSIDEVQSKLGPEPFDADFTEKVFAGRIKGKTAPIKALLLDQAFIAGVGNMYADEALFAAKIHPERVSGNLSKNELQRLYHAIRDVLAKGIERGGASVVTYFHPDGSQGTAHTHFNVAHAQVKNCRECGTAIARLVVRGRGTYYCPKCQPR
jgi:formamidopyrimidine-DNA glycosylase